MFANFISETCTGTNGDLTLLGAQNGFIDFDSVFNDTDQVYYVVEDANGINKCAGVGTYNLPGNTITRNDNWTWNGTTYTDSPGGNLVLSGGTHVVRIAPLAARMIQWDAANAWSDAVDSNIVFDAHNTRNIGSDSVRAANIYTRNIHADVTANLNDIIATGDHDLGSGELIFAGHFESSGSSSLNDVVLNGATEVLNGLITTGNLSPTSNGVDNIGGMSFRYNGGYFDFVVANEFTGEHIGSIDCGTVIAPSTVNIQSHIDVYNGQYGMNYSSDNRLNIVAGITRAMSFNNSDVYSHLEHNFLNGQVGLDLVDLDDVTESNLTSGNFLIFSPKGSGTWENSSADMNALSDTDMTGAVSEDLLGYNGTDWIPLTLLEGNGIKLTTGTGTLSVDSVQSTQKHYADLTVTGPQSVLNTSVYIDWDFSEINDADVTVSGDNANINVTGRYEIYCEARVQTDNRAELILQIELNGSPITEEIVSDYIARDTDQDTGSVGIYTVMDLTSGDDLKFELEGDCDGTFCTIIAGTRLIINRLR